MHSANFCSNCGERVTRKGWRAWLRGPLCDDCAARAGIGTRARTFVAIGIVAVAAFAMGRYLRPSPPPLIIHRAANSPLSDLPVNLAEIADKTGSSKQNTGNATGSSADDVVYLCGARTKKGTPCRRRVHFAGERCYQHKGRPAMVPLEKLTVKP